MRVYQCDRCGAIIKGNEKVTKLQLEQYIDGGYVDGSNCKRDLCKKCADRLMKEANGEPVGQPDGMINAKRLLEKIEACCCPITRYEGNNEVTRLGIMASDIKALIREELSEENDDE